MRPQLDLGTSDDYRELVEEHHYEGWDLALRGRGPVENYEEYLSEKKKRKLIRHFNLKSKTLGNS